MLWANPKAEMSDPGSMLAGDGGWWESARWKPTYKKRIYVITSPAVGYASSDGLFQLESVASKSAAKLSLAASMERDAYTRHHSLLSRTSHVGPIMSAPLGHPTAHPSTTSKRSK